MQNRRNAVYLLIILALLTGLFTGQAFFFNLAYLFGGLLILSFLWSWLSVRWIGISRQTRARRAQVGRNLDEVFIVQNRAYLPKLWLEVRDFSTLPGHRASHVIPTMGIRSRYRWYVQTPCRVRGEFKLGPMTIISGDPFGLFLSPRFIGATENVIVYPMVVPVSNFHLPTSIISGGETQRRRAHFITTNAAGVREYVTGDSFNRIHWASTARRDRLMVKEFEIDPLVDIWLLVDFSAESRVEAPSIKRDANGYIVPTGDTIPPSTEEYNVVIGASLANYFVGLERALGFAAYTPNRDLHQPERGHRQLTRILQSLAIARSVSDYSLAEMLTLEAPYLTRGTALIIITASLDEDWIAEAQILSRRGIKPIVVLTDPQSFGGASSEDIQTMLRIAKIPTIVVHRQDNISAALAQRPL